MMNKSLTYTAIFEASSLNYGEGTANISELKKFHRGNGDVYTFASRQSMRYDVVRMGNQLFGWNLNTVDKSKQVIQFKDEVTIKESVEMDLFGYLKTSSNSQKRPAVARLSHALSLEPYQNDMEFLNNMGLAERINETPNLANIEQHHSYYTYTLTVDLYRVGIDGEIELPAEERKKRIEQLLEILKVLYRDIRGRRENLSPFFIIGGVYPVSNPFFMGRLRLRKGETGFAIDVEQLKEVANMTWQGRPVLDDTVVGCVKGWLTNEEELNDAFAGKVYSVDQAFTILKEEAGKVYG